MPCISAPGYLHRYPMLMLQLKTSCFGISVCHGWWAPSHRMCRISFILDKVIVTSYMTWICIYNTQWQPAEACRSFLRIGFAIFVLLTKRGWMLCQRIWATITSYYILLYDSNQIVMLFSWLLTDFHIWVLQLHSFFYDFWNELNVFTTGT